MMKSLQAISAAIVLGAALCGCGVKGRPIAESTPVSVVATASESAAASRPASANSKRKAYAIQVPTQFPEDSPQRALAAYIAGWRARDWAAMYRATGPGFRQDEIDAQDSIRAWHDTKDLVGFKVLEPLVYGPEKTSCQVTYVVSYYDEQGLASKQTTALLLKETAAHKQSPSGTWGVYPLSGSLPPD